MLKVCLQRERNSTTLAFMGRLLGSEKGLDTVQLKKILDSLACLGQGEGSAARGRSVMRCPSQRTFYDDVKNQHEPSQEVKVVRGSGSPQALSTDLLNDDLIRDDDFI